VRMFETVKSQNCSSTKTEALSRASGRLSRQIPGGFGKLVSLGGPKHFHHLAGEEGSTKEIGKLVIEQMPVSKKTKGCQQMTTDLGAKGVFNPVERRERFVLLGIEVPKGGNDGSITKDIKGGSNPLSKGEIPQRGMWPSRNTTKGLGGSATYRGANN